MNNNCLICKENFENAITLPCKHTYCNICFKAWYKSNKPICCYCTQPFNLLDYLELNYFEMPREYLKNIITSAIETFDKKTLKEIIEETESSDPMDLAIKNGRLEILKYLHSIGAKCSEFGMYCGCLNGNLEIVKFLSSIGVMGDLSMLCASATGNIEVVKYLYENGLQFTSDCMYLAYSGNHENVIEFFNSIK